MSADDRLPVVLCWHMHQPEYREPLGGIYHLPWTYLHAIKDYVDMAAHLEQVPGARAVVNFTPTLLEQIADYARQVRGFLEAGQPISDRLLYALASPVLPTGPAERLELVRACLRANRQRMIDRFPAYASLAELAEWLLEHPAQMAYASDQFLIDLLVWYHLAWLGETVRREEAWVGEMQERGGHFSTADRRRLLGLVGRLLEEVVPRYRKLAEAGQIELSVTPYAHPILPLLLDFRAAAEVVPEIELPVSDHYPGGAERAAWHIEHGLEVFEAHFGHRPRGCWPAEGGVSTAAVQLLGRAGFEWVATGGSVLHNSLAASGTDPGPCLHRPYRIAEGGPACFFRDDGLSDLIGFTYSEWHADDAVANLVHHLEQIAGACGDVADRVVSIIMDGENAWEYYPENGYHFLSALYKALVGHPRLRLTTFSECLERAPARSSLPKLVAGSWVYGSFTTWIGHRDKNRAWDMLVEAKRGYDRHGPDPQGERERQLAICEGSDWFWWFGDDNPAESVADFDRLYRLQLSHLYALLGEEAPEYLAHSFSQGGGSPARGGVMRAGRPAGA